MKDVITRQQALAKDITPAMIRHRLRTGRWQQIFPGVYLMHSGTPTWRERLMAATLARGAGTVASLECALNLWGLIAREPPILTLAEPIDTRRTCRLPGVRVRRRRRLARARRHGIPVTSAAQTVLDVLALPGRTPDDDVALITRAVRTKKVTVESLRAELEHHPRHPRRAALAEILAAAADGLESVVEVRYVERVEAPHGLPRMERQAPMDGPTAVRDGRSRRIDFRDKARGIRLEIDGELYHRDKQVQDRGRDREAAGKGEVTLRAGWAEACGPSCAVGRDTRVRGW